MKKRAFLFPGQGSQTVGMGSEFMAEYPVYREVIRTADEVLDFSASTLIAEGPADQLNQTQYTQPCLLAASLGVYRILEEKGIHPDAVAGLSLGEYTALAAAGVIDMKTAIALVRKRGLWMEEAVPGGGGAMMAILGSDRETIERICTEVTQEAAASGNASDIVAPANYNCPGQIVISGEKTLVEKAGALLKEAGAKRVVALATSGPFHTSMLSSAGDKLKEEFKTITWEAPEMAYYTNVGGVQVTDPQRIPEILVQQVQSGVYFEDLIRQMIEDGITEFVEVGPGRALSGFVKKISREVSIYNIEDEKSLAKYLEAVQTEA